MQQTDKMDANANQNPSTICIDTPILPSVLKVEMHTLCPAYN